jgi:hypothetical protein
VMKREELDAVISKALPNWGTVQAPFVRRAYMLGQVGKSATKKKIWGEAKAEKDAVDALAKEIVAQPYRFMDRGKMLDILEKRGDIEQKLNQESAANWPITEKRLEGVTQSVINALFTRDLTFGPVHVASLEANPPKVKELRVELKNSDDPTQPPTFVATGKIHAHDQRKGEPPGEFTIVYSAVGGIVDMSLNLGPAVLRAIKTQAQKELGPGASVTQDGFVHVAA